MKRIISLILVSTILAAGAPALAAQSFTDVPSGSWYSDYVNQMTSRGVFNGLTPTTFSPGTPMTRGMFVTALGRYANASASGTGSSGIITKDGVNMRSQPNTDSSILAVLGNGTVVQIKNTSGIWYNIQHEGKTGYVRNDLMEPVASAFSDVSASMYCSDYVEWAFSKNIVSGTSDNKFSPDANITREQICSILYNYASSINLRIEPKYDKQSFKDDTAIQAWARDSVYIMQQAGIINGRDNGCFAPAESASRAEVAAIMSRFIECVSYKPEPTPQLSADGGYIFGTAVPESGSVSDSYFSDAVFIGNSFVDGMRSYFNLPGASFYAVTGISASGMLSYPSFGLKETFENDEGETEHKKGTLFDALAERQGEYNKVYLVFGTNELGSKDSHKSAFYGAMNSLISLVRASQPDAKLYLLSVPPISRSRSEESASYNRDNAIAFNSVLKRISLENGAYYLDIFSLFSDENGYLPGEHCLSDGIHILKPQYAALKAFLKTHTM